MIIADKMNESRNLNEALKPSKIGWYGNSNPKLPYSHLNYQVRIRQLV